jgi:segregation and condensation protein B
VLFRSTKEFLDYFNLKKLSELPSLSEIKDFDQINPDLFEELEKEARNEVARNKVARAGIAGQQIGADEQVAIKEDEISSATEEPEEEMDAEENTINDEDNVVPFG